MASRLPAAVTPGPDPALAELGYGADPYILDATGRGQRAGGRPASGEVQLNLSGRQAGAVAAAARPRRLMLTHFWPGNDRERTRAEAQESFHGDVLLATEA